MKTPVSSSRFAKLSLAALLAYSAFNGLSLAQTIGVNFTGRDDNDAGNGGNPVGVLGIDELAGVVAQRDWTNLSYGQWTGGTNNNLITTSNLMADDGNLGTSGTSNVSISVRANDSWHTDARIANPNSNGRMMDGIIKTGNGNNSPTFQFGGLSRASYRVIVYTAQNNNNAGRYAMTVGGVSYYGGSNNGFNGTYVQNTNTTAGTFPLSDYVNVSSTDVMLGFLNIGFQFEPGGSGEIGIAGIQLIRLAALSQWSGAVNGNWNTTTANWTGPATTWTNGTTAIFADVDDNSAPVVTRNVTVGAGVAPLAVVVDNSTGDYTFGGGSIGGSGPLTKTGSATLFVNGTHSYTGGTTVTNGTIQLGNNNALADSGAVIVSGGTLALGAFSDTVGVVTLTGGTISGSSGVLSGSSFDLRSGSVTGILGGAGALTKSTNGVVTLTGTNTYTGGTNVTEGVLQADDGVGLSASLLTLNGGVLETSTNLIRSVGTGVGQVQLTGGVSGFSSNGSPIVVALGGLATPAALTWGDPAFNPSSLVLNPSSATSTLEFRNALNLNGANRTITVGATGSGTEVTASGVVSGVGGSLTKSGAGTLILSALNTYDGGTNINAGTLRLASAAALPAAAPVTVATGGFLDLNGNNVAIGVLGGNGTVINDTPGASASVLTISSGSVGGIVNGTGAGTISVVKTSPGTFRLAGNNTYSGGTTINAGTFIVGTNSALGSGAVILSGGATLEFGVQAGLNLGAVPDNDNAGTPNPNTFIVNTVGLHNVNTENGQFPTSVPNDTTAVYTGFLNNTTGSAQTWAFAENFDQYALLRINGQTILNDGSWNTPTRGAAVLNPGLNSFEVRLGNDGGGVGDSNQGWFNNNLGFGVNVGNTDGAPVGSSTNTAGTASNYVAPPVDPGDGSVFVANVVNSISNTVNVTGNATFNVGYHVVGVASVTLGQVNIGTNTLSVTGVTGLTAGNVKATTTVLSGNPTFNPSAGITFGTGAINGGVTNRTITVTGAGTVRADVASTLTSGSVVNVTSGATLALGGPDAVATNPVGDALITLTGGKLLLDGRQGLVDGLRVQLYNVNPGGNIGNYNDLGTLNTYLNLLTAGFTGSSTTGGKLNFDYSNEGYGNGAPFNGNEATRAAYGFTPINDIQARWTGFINVAAPGLATFQSRSDDGSMIFIDGTAVVNNNAFQAATTVTNTYNFTTAGLHEITLAFYEGGGGSGALFQWDGSGSMQTLLSAETKQAGIGATQAFTNNVTISQNSEIAVSNSLAASIGVVSIGAQTLTVSSPSATNAAYSLTAASTTLTGNATFNVNNSTGGGVGTFNPGTISGGTNSVTKSGNGILFLGQANTYSGGTTVTGGKVIVTNGSGSATGSGSVALSGGKLGGNGTVSGSVTATTGGGLDLVNSTTGQLTIGGGLTLGTGTTFNLDVASTGVSDFVQVGTTFALSGSISMSVNGLAGFALGSSYTIATGTVALSNTASYTVTGTGTALGAFFTVTTLGNSLILNASSPAVTWTGATNNVWDSNTTPNWSPQKFQNGFTVTFDDSGNNTSITAPAPVAPLSTIFNNTTAKTYTINGVIGGPGGITKTANGTVILVGASTYSGAVSNTGGGTLQFGDATANGTVSGNITNNAALIFHNPAAQTYNGVISGSGTLTKNGNGTLDLGSTSSFSGNTTVNAGTLRLNVGGEPGTLSGSGSITINSGGTVLAGTTDAVGYSNHGAGTNDININEGGTLSVVTGSRLSIDRDINSVGGTITSQGVGDISNASYTVRNSNGGIYTFTSSAGGTPSTISAIGFGLQGTTTFNVTDGAGAVDLNVSGTVVNFSEAGNLVKNGTGKMVLGGTNSYSGTTTVNAGILQVGAGGAAGTLGGGAVTNDASLIIDRTGSLSVPNNIGGTGILTKNGSGNAKLSGNSSYSGGTVINTGTITAATSTALGTGGVTMNGGVLSLGGPLINSFDGFVLNNGATLVGDVLTLTTLQNNQRRSAFTGTQQSVTNAAGFSANFIYDPTTGGADGATFTIQNQGSNALGGNGGQLGYGGITFSGAVAFNIWSGATGGVGTQFVNGGTSPQGSPYQGVGPVALAGGNPIQVNLNYNGVASTLTQILTDTITNQTSTLTYSGVDFESFLGGQVGYIGFTGGTGGESNQQAISAFNFSTNAGLDFDNDVTVSAAATAELNLAAKGDGSNGKATINDLDVLAGANLNITGGSLTMDSLNIGAGAVVTLGASVNPFNGGFAKDATSAVVPEPGTVGLLLVGALGVLARRRRTQG